MPFPGLPVLPWIVFWSGDILVYIRDTPIIRSGVPFKRVYMIPTEQVVWRYNIDQEKLNYEISEFGVLIREYPSDHFHWLSQSPENQLVFISCNFDGSTTIGMKIIEQGNKLTRLTSVIKTLENENSEIRDKLRVAVERLRVLEAKS